MKKIMTMLVLMTLVVMADEEQDLREYFKKMTNKSASICSYSKGSYNIGNNSFGKRTQSGYLYCNYGEYRINMVLFTSVSDIKVVISGDFYVLENDNQ